MREPASKRDPVRLSLRRLGIVALLVLVGLVASGVWDVYKKEKESRALRTRAEAQLQDLTREESHLNLRISNLKTERGKEEALREHYEIGKEGESLIIIVDPTAPEPVQASSSFMRIFQRAFSWW